MSYKGLGYIGAIAIFCLLGWSCGSDDKKKASRELKPVTTPTLVHASSTVIGNLITWRPVDGATSYLVYWDKVDNAESFDLEAAKREQVQEHQFSHNGLQVGATYYYAVSAIGPLGESAPSSKLPHVFSLKRFEPTPRNLRAQAGDGKVSLTWNGVEGASQYKVYYSTSQAVSDADEFIPVSENRLVHDGLNNTQTYYYVVSSVTRFGDSRTSNMAFATPVPVAAKPDVVALNVATVVDQQKITVLWDAVPLAASYEIHWSQSPVFNPGDAGVTAVAVANRYFVHIGLKANETYYYRLVAVNAAGKSLPSDIFDATAAIAVQPPGQVFGLSAQGSQQEVVLRWNDIPNVDAYDVYWLDTTTQDPLPTNPVTPANGNLIAAVTSPFVHAVEPDKRYHYMVVARNIAGSGAPSQTVLALTRNYWIQQIKTSVSDMAVDVGVDLDGNIYQLGNSPADIAQNGKTGVGDDVVLIKYDREGRVIWRRSVGSPDFDNATALHVAANGDVVVTGWTSGDIVSRKTVFTDYDIFVARFNGGGDLLYVKQFGTDKDDVANGIDMDAAGNIYIAGRTQGPLQGAAKVGDDDDGFVMKLNGDGEPQWASLVQTGGYDEANSVAVSDDGFAHVTGFTSAALEGHDNAGDEDMFIRRLNPQGATVWTDQVGSVKNDAARAVDVGADGDIYVAAVASAQITSEPSTSPLQGISSVVMLRYRADGQRLSLRQYESGGRETIHDIKVDTAGSAYVVGSSTGNWGGQQNAGLSDIMVLKFDAGGELAASKLIGTVETDVGRGVALGSQADLYLVGGTHGDLSLLGKSSRANDWFIKREPR